MNKKQKKVLIRVIVASVLLILCAVLPTTGYVRFATFMVPYLVIGYDEKGLEGNPEQTGI